jgi:hypothetical protein
VTASVTVAIIAAIAAVASAILSSIGAARSRATQLTIEREKLVEGRVQTVKLTCTSQ